jgi:hypothetical protein
MAIRANARDPMDQQRLQRGGELVVGEACDDLGVGDIQ